MTRRFHALSRHALSWLLAFVTMAFVSLEADAGARQKQISRSKQTATAARPKPQVASAARHKRHASPAARHKRQASRAKKARTAKAKAPAPAPAALPILPDPPSPAWPELSEVRQVIELLRKQKPNEAAAIQKSMGDPVARKLAQWIILRHGDGGAGFDRYAAFIAENPGWPIRALRRRAEGRLWHERRDPALVRGFLAEKPATARGRFALARALMAAGDRGAAEREAREAWRAEELSADLESEAIETFRDMLTRADHRARMDRRIGRKDFAGAMRAARRLGDDEIAIVKACVAASANAAKARALLEAVPAAARGNLGYSLCHIAWLLRQDRVAEAARATLAVAREELPLQDTDEWWRQRRALARKLLDLGDAETAYRVVREAAPPANENYRAEFHFMSGWIALRFLDDPFSALADFARVADGSVNPIVLARAAYWQGRAAEAAHRIEEMREHYRAAARYSTAYYGQLARAKLGLDQLELRAPPAPDPCRRAGLADELVRATAMLYALGQRDLVLQFVSELAERSADEAALAALAELSARHDDARAMLLIGKTALARGHALDHYAFPDIGVPRYSPIAPDIDRSIVYSVVRTESAFDQRDMSPAKAVGLMQVTPVAGRDTAKRFGVAYDWKRLMSDPVYNTQMGAAELSALLREYRGSQIMTFAGYNAGRGRVQQWVKQRGDPRDPKVDPVDWVERIPFSETRNYVQRVMENVQVYRARFEDDSRVNLELGWRRALARQLRSASNAPTAFTPID